jgi:hypothetical protein
MTRRGLVAMGACAAAPEPKLPSDMDTMNAFAAAYNGYVEQVQRGVVDLRKWQAVLKAWRKLMSQ